MQPPVLDYHNIFKQSTEHTPIVFVLSPGKRGGGHTPIVFVLSPGKRGGGHTPIVFVLSPGKREGGGGAKGGGGTDVNEDWGGGRGLWLPAPPHTLVLLLPPCPATAALSCYCHVLLLPPPLGFDPPHLLPPPRR